MYRGERLLTNRVWYIREQKARKKILKMELAGWPGGGCVQRPVLFIAFVVGANKKCFTQKQNYFPSRVL